MNYTHVARFIDENGYKHIRVVDENSLDDMMKIFDEAVLETVSFEKIDHEAIIDEFCDWMNKVTLVPWNIEYMDNNDVMNWCRYQAVDWWKVIVVKQFLKDCKK